MATTTINSTDSGATSRTVINDNFTDLDTTKADLDSPTFTGTPTLPTGTIAVTQSASDNSTKIATTAYVDAAGGATKLEIDTTEITVDATTTETTLFDYSVVGGKLSTNNAIRFKVWFSAFRNEDTWTVRVKFGGTTVSATVNSSVNFGSWIGTLEGMVVADGSTSAQKIMFTGLFHTATGDYNTVNSENTSTLTFGGSGAGTEDSTTTKTLSVTLQNSGTNPSTTTVEFWTVELIK